MWVSRGTAGVAWVPPYFPLWFVSSCVFVYHFVYNCLDFTRSLVFCIVVVPSLVFSDDLVIWWYLVSSYDLGLRCRWMEGV